MNRETELHFSGVPQVHKPRSKMVIPHDLLTSWDMGQLIPIYTTSDILPGDSIKFKMGSVIRMATPLYPIFGNIVADIMAFFVPHRLVWEHWREFWGENKNAWYQTQEYLVPQIECQNIGFDFKSLADYMEIRPNIPGIKVSQLPFRAYCKIWNDWFRSESLQQEVPFNITDTDLYYNANHKETARGGAILNANKLMDMFTGSLPSPQKGPDVTLPLGSWAEVYTRSEKVTFAGNFPAMTWHKNGADAEWASNGIYGVFAGVSDTTGKANANAQVSATSTGSGTYTPVAPSNLWADLSHATSATINSLRTAFSIQRFYEAQANGSRYIEFIRNIFGVTSPDARLQRSEYLGGKRIPINIQTVLKTSSTDETSPLGQTGAFSHTADADELFNHSFTEHGTLIVLMCCRYYHGYDQMIPAHFTRRKWTDYYVPQFANLGAQPILNKHIFVTGTNTDDEVFGYQEAWANGYRYMPNTATGAMRTDYPQSLDSWHLTDSYETTPSLGSTWIQEDKTTLDRALAVTSEVENQFFGDFYFRPVYTRVMPLYSIPGLVNNF